MQNKTEEKKSSTATVLADDGFYFGIGAFETIAVEDGVPQLLEWHLERLRKSLAFFGIDQNVKEQEVLTYLNICPQSEEKQHGAFKITVTAENKLFGLRKNTYTKEQYQKGFRLGISEIRRMRLRRSRIIRRLGLQTISWKSEMPGKADWMKRFFLIRKGRSARAARQTFFFIQGNRLVTPPVSSGMLPGVMRRYIIEEAGRRGVLLEEKELYPEETDQFDGCFVTNSLLGVMPAASFEEQKFDTAKVLRFMEKFHYKLQ